MQHLCVMKKRIIKTSLYLIGGLLTIIFGLSVVLWIASHGIDEPITDLNGRPMECSISVIEKAELGGLDYVIVI